MPALHRGWKKSSRPARHHFAAHAAAQAGSVPDSVSLASFALPHFDQGQTGSCVGHATSGACGTSLNKAGLPLGFAASPCGIYTVARCVTRAHDNQTASPLQDEGAEPADAMVGITQFGVHTIHGPTSDGRNSDCDPATVNAEPVLEDLIADSCMLLVGEYEITSSGSARVLDVCKALAAGCAVCVGFFVDMGFENWQAGDPPYGAPVNPNDPQGGGHYVYIIGYTTDGSGHRVYTVRNSWGDSWGDNGDFLASEAWLTDSQVSDVYAMAVKENA